MRLTQTLIGSLALIIFLLMPFLGTASGPNPEEGDGKFDPKELINSHVWDSHEFHIADWSGHPITLALPVILWTENGLTVFPSSEFHHDNSGTTVVEANGQEFVKYREHIFYADRFDKEKFEAASTMGRPFLYEDRPLDFSITKTVFSMLLVSLLLVLIFGFAARSYKKNKKAPKGISGLLEPVILFVRDEIALPNIGNKYQKYMPLLLTIFFFIWLNNLIGLIPFFPFSGNVTGNIIFTLVMAVIVFIVTIFSGNKYYWKHILTPDVPKALYPIMIPIEIIGMFTKPFALMVRLFANITAGHIIILSLVGLIFIFETAAISPVSIAFVLFMSVLELLVAALQAYVFTLLAALFIGQAVEEHH
ncbi:MULTISPECIES: F0F1 ATP synthase subunit A [Aequorivita]|jgi:F-type H+-transporting ATPase subunit a|uniref:ATP synthase subunit a n=2 Tax=Aequorivita TaxID=153265 RepID=A0AB35YNC1_9FLAO|nr:F0F1 ATP synthase subunit A [Aequorivita sp. Ant34-E75]WGF93583.1 F0F1 ATP synthase subunit A [Aequorivita sp. Ant34-E75]